MSPIFGQAKYRDVALSLRSTPPGRVYASAGKLLPAAFLIPSGFLANSPSPAPIPVVLLQPIRTQSPG